MKRTAPKTARFDLRIAETQYNLLNTMAKAKECSKARVIELAILYYAKEQGFVVDNVTKNESAG